MMRLKRLEKLNRTNKAYLFLILYALFAFNRIKIMGLPRVDGIAIINMFAVTLLACFCIAFLCGRTTRLDYENKQKLWMLFLLIWIVPISLLLTDNAAQTVYALFVMLAPMFLLITVNKQTHEQFLTVLKYLNGLALIYSILTIISSLNYSTMMALIGNTASNYSEHTRAILPLGSSISVSYYLNISLPLALYLFANAEGKGSRAYYIVTIALNIAATMLQLSRSATLMAVLILLFYLFFIKTKFGFRRKIVLYAIIVVGAIWLSGQVDLTRLVRGFYTEDGMDDARKNAYELAAYLFSKNPWIGTGVGAVFHRAWYGSNVVSVDGVSGLVDPHNVYALLLSELGIIGTALYVIFMYGVIARISKNKDKLIRLTGFLIIATLLGNSIVGSQLINEAPFSTIAFIYLAVFVGRSFDDKKG